MECSMDNSSQNGGFRCHYARINSFMFFVHFIHFQLDRERTPLSVTTSGISNAQGNNENNQWIIAYVFALDNWLKVNKWIFQHLICLQQVKVRLIWTCQINYAAYGVTQKTTQEKNDKLNSVHHMRVIEVYLYNAVHYVKYEIKLSKPYIFSSINHKNLCFF